MTWKDNGSWDVFGLNGNGAAEPRWLSYGLRDRFGRNSCGQASQATVVEALNVAQILCTKWADALKYCE